MALSDSAVCAQAWRGTPDPRALRAVKDTLDAQGAALVRGGTTADFMALSEALGHGFVEHQSPLRTATALDPTVKTVDGGTHAIALHCELAYLPVHLELVSFYCVAAAEQGGETILADGVALAASLTPKTRQLLERRRLRYALRVPGALWPAVEAAIGDQPLASDESFCILGRAVEGGIEAEFVTPALVRSHEGAAVAFANSVLSSLDPDNHVARQLYDLTFDDGEAIPPAVVRELDEVAGRVSVAVPLAPGDLLLLDNRRVLHGRRAFTGHRAILSRFARRRRAPGGL